MGGAATAPSHKNDVRSLGKCLATRAMGPGQYEGDTVLALGGVQLEVSGYHGKMMRQPE
jgi:hypothetical protein